MVVVFSMRQKAHSRARHGPRRRAPVYDAAQTRMRERAPARRSPKRLKEHRSPRACAGSTSIFLPVCRSIRGRGRQFSTAARLPSFLGDTSGSPLPGRLGRPLDNCLRTCVRGL